MRTRIYDWDTCPDMDLLDKRVVWWNEDYICIKKDEGKRPKCPHSVSKLLNGCVESLAVSL